MTSHQIPFYERWRENKYKDIDEMMRNLCTSEVTQLETLRRFIEYKPKLKPAVQDKNWERIARYYNGNSPKNIRIYAPRLKAAYEKLTKATHGKA